MQLVGIENSQSRKYYILVGVVSWANFWFGVNSDPSGLGWLQ